MQIPRNQTFAEALYSDIDNNEYLNEIYESLLYNYSIHIFRIQKQPKEVNIKDALQFADLLAKSTMTRIYGGIPQLPGCCQGKNTLDIQ